MAEIDVQITFDAESIISDLKGNTDPNNPKMIDNPDKYIFMVVAGPDHVVTGQGGSALNIKARTENVIHWSEATPGVDYSTIMYAFVASDPNQQLISTPEPHVATVTVLVPTKKDPTNPTKQEIKDFYWSCEVESPGNMAYHFKFMIADRDGKKLGYYTWDPFISITS